VALLAFVLIAWLGSKWRSAPMAGLQDPMPQAPYGQSVPMASVASQDARAHAGAVDPIEIDPAELEPLVDGVMEEQRRKFGMPGAAVTIVQNAGVLLSKGYGFADAGGQRPVDPAETVFEVGLISQLVSAAAVLQQVDAGALDLDRDVNDDLDGVAVESGPTIALRDLLVQADAMPVAEYIAAHPPLRSRPPREAIAWNATDYLLAGHLVERATGVRFADAVDAGILEPLGMTDSSFLRPERLRDRMAHGHNMRPGGFAPYHVEYYSHLVPVGNLVATTEDIGRFMSMILQRGVAGGRRVLSTQSVDAMTTRQFSHHPRMSGNSLGFRETTWNGHRVLHSVDLVFMGFSSHMMLLPDDGVGLFVAYNNNAYLFMWPHLDDVFLREFLGGKPDDYDPWAADTAAPKDVARYAGYYRYNGYAHRGFNKSNLLMWGFDVKLVVTPDGNLIESNRRDYPGFAPVEPGLFRSGSQYLSFREENGQVTDSQTAHRVFERVPWLFTVKVQRWLMLVCLLLMASGLLAWLEGYSSRNRVDASLDDDRRTAAARAWKAAAVPSALLLGFFVGMFVLGQMLDPLQALFEGYPTSLYVLLALPILALPLIARTGLHTARAWTGQALPARPRVHLSLVLLAQITMIWFLHNWNMLGWKL
jgi:CubicO group peptidase (beta-lactamase class C family)